MKKYLGENDEVLLESEGDDTEKVILFLPGISGKAHSDRFAPLTTAGNNKGFATARVSLWESEADVHSLSLIELFAKLDLVVEMLMEEGYAHIVMIGKSFGGGVTLLYTNDYINQKIMWAPAVGVAEGSGNILDLSGTLFGELDDLLDIKVGTDELLQIDIPIGIVHGTSDTVIPIDNSKSIINSVGDGELAVVEGADHSFKTVEHAQQLMEATSNFL